MKVMAYAQGPDSAGIQFSRCDFRHRRNIYRTFYGHGTDAAQRHELRATLLLHAGGKPIATVYRTCEVAPTLGVKDIEDANGTNAAYSANPSTSTSKSDTGSSSTP